MVVALYLIAFSTDAQPSKSAQESLRQSSAHFDRGQYQKALLLLAAVNISRDFDNSDDMKLAFKIRAIAYEQTGDQAKARETIRELFFLDPNYQFNPFDTPTSVVSLAQKEKAAIDAKNQHLAVIKNEAKETKAEKEKNKETASPVSIVGIKNPPSMAVTLFPLGLNHFALDSPVKGGIYLSLQTLGLVTNVAAFWWKSSYLTNLGSARLKNADKESGFKTAQTFQYIGLSALLLSYGISIVDALIRFQRITSQNLDSDEITS
jgi:tetratricopeptide (TPR) repeat protein